MSNVVEHYQPKAECAGLGSFFDDRRSFGHHGAKRDMRVNNDAVALVKDVHHDFGQPSASSITRLLQNERVLGRVPHEGYQFLVHIRVRDNAAITFYAHRTTEGYVTYLLGVQTNPPPHGEQDWWRSSIKPRLEELLGK